MNGTMTLTHKPVIPGSGEVQTTYEEFQLEHQEVCCPDCFDTMIRIYDSEDKVRYRCENCDLVLGDVNAVLY